MAASGRATTGIKPQWEKRTWTRVTGPSDELEGKWLSLSSLCSGLALQVVIKEQKKKVIVDG